MTRKLSTPIRTGYGRPKVAKILPPEKHKLYFALTPEEHDALTQFASEDNSSLSQVVGKMIVREREWREEMRGNLKVGPEESTELRPVRPGRPAKKPRRSSAELKELIYAAVPLGTRATADAIREELGIGGPTLDSVRKYLNILEKEGKVTSWERRLLFKNTIHYSKFWSRKSPKT